MKLTSGYLSCAMYIGSSNKYPGVTTTLAPSLTAKSIDAKYASVDCSVGL